MTQLEQSLVDVVGGKSAKALEKAFGMKTVADLLTHYPRRYQRRGDLTDMTELVDDEDVTVLAEIVSVTNRRMQRKRGSILEAIITDGQVRLSITFFNQHWRERELRAGRRGLFAGRVSTYRGKRQLAHPAYILLPDGLDDDAGVAESFAGEIIPVYPATSGVTSWDLAKAVDVALASIDAQPDPIPEAIRTQHGLIDFDTALRAIHRPADDDALAAARARLTFDEAFILQVLLAQRRHLRAQAAARVLGSASGPLVQAFDAQLPFELTASQQRAATDITADVGRSFPMHRLLQGDVGSGKTVVALRAMLAAVDEGHQAALLAPTEVLATQHHASITALLGPLAQGGLLGGSDIGTRVALLTGSQSTATRRQQLLDIVSGDAGIVVGTHALLQESVEFNDLAIVVIDEQHRFGVTQRAALSDKATVEPHVLVMTATPIPRSVAMTVFGDLDITTLDELPAGRQPIATHVVHRPTQPQLLDRLWQRAREEIGQGHRVFVVAPRIEDEDTDSVLASVVEVAERLTQHECSGIRIGTLHGRMSADEKNDAMRRFSDATAADPIELLVATTVIEVGIDVPIATMMVVLDADRFGISQLHQLRGRIGRGGLPGLCVLVTDQEPGTPATARLDAVAATCDGFALANADLAIRREGDVLGNQQSGRRSSLRLLRVIDDADIIAAARSEARAIIEADPSLESFPDLRAAVQALVDEEQADYLERG
jgi:ATP-dependent DNA helicase RecG